MEILIFRTNLSNHDRISEATPHITSLHGIHNWNVDLYDIDCVLRIEADQLSPRHVEQTLQEAGYFCQELED